jgi:hypothetical protein
MAQAYARSGDHDLARDFLSLGDAGLGPGAGGNDPLRAVCSWSRTATCSRRRC